MAPYSAGMCTGMMRCTTPVSAPTGSIATAGRYTVGRARRVTARSVRPGDVTDVADGEPAQRPHRHQPAQHVEHAGGLVAEVGVVRAQCGERVRDDDRGALGLVPA